MAERPELRKEPGLGPLLKELRGSLGLSHKDVAVAVWGDEAKWNWYSKLENRPNAYPSDTDLDRILAVLGSSRDEAELKLGRRTWSDPVQRPPEATFAMSAAPPPMLAAAYDPGPPAAETSAGAAEPARPAASPAAAPAGAGAAAPAPAPAGAGAAAPAPAPAPAAAAARAAAPGRKSLRSRLSARAAVQAPGAADVARAAAPAPPFSEPQELRREGIRLLAELSGEDLEHAVRQLRSLRARSRRD